MSVTMESVIATMESVIAIWSSRSQPYSRCLPYQRIVVVAVCYCPSVPVTCFTCLSLRCCAQHPVLPLLIARRVC